MTVRTLAALGGALLSIGLSGCGASNGLEGWNDEIAAAQIGKQLREKGFNLGEPHRCSEWFEVGEPKIIDVSYPGGSGVAVGLIVEAKARTPVRAKEAIGEGARIAEFCYGWPPGGYSAGQSSNYLHTFAFRRWRTGWQIMDQAGQ